MPTNDYGSAITAYHVEVSAALPRQKSAPSWQRAYSGIATTCEVSPLLNYITATPQSLACTWAASLGEIMISVLSGIVPCIVSNMRPVSRLQGAAGGFLQQQVLRMQQCVQFGQTKIA